MKKIITLTDILLITPPFTQLNTPYPATTYLTGFLKSKNISVFQADLSIEVILNIFSKNGLTQLFTSVFQINQLSDNATRIYALREEYIQTIDEVITFLQGNSPSVARQICGDGFLPQAARFDAASDHDWAFGDMGIQDKAKHLATLYLEDISDFIIECIDPQFGFSRYAEQIGRCANSFDHIYAQLQQSHSYIDSISTRILQKLLNAQKPKMVCFTVPFPGNLISALRCAQYIKKHYPEIKTVMGGGFTNTELRSVKDTRVFEFFDFITLDDGERPLELLHTHINSQLSFNKRPLKRTFGLHDGSVFYNNQSDLPDYKQEDLPTPDYSNLPLDKYISVIEMANPMQSIWSDGRWNKLTMAHGCYWGRCTFCDVTLSYIKDHQLTKAVVLVDHIEAMIKQTNERGFHFVDEAAHPALMKALALEIIKRKLVVTWWTNIRFEKSFTSDLCRLLKASGCIAVSGGLEVASDRLLGMINKGVNVEQVAQVCDNLTSAGIMVHAYLMYGYPTQTIQETVDSLEIVRQLFDLGIVQSGFWHQFALTAHSPIGLNPKKYNITPHYKEITFANNDIDFTDKTGINHKVFSYGLKKSLYNFMHGVGFDFPLWEWFDPEELGFKLPRTTVNKDLIQNALVHHPSLQTKPTKKVVWLGDAPITNRVTKNKKGRSWQMLEMVFHSKTSTLNISVEYEKGIWLKDILPLLSVNAKEYMTYKQLKDRFEEHFPDFELFWFSKPILKLRNCGLLVL